MLTIVVVRKTVDTQGELSEGCGRNTSTSVRIAEQTTVAATVKAGVRSRVGGEVAVTTTLRMLYLDME